MNKLKEQFLQGFKEGWTVFWSPFAGFFSAISKLWHSHVDGQHTQKHHA
jgi:hypothetical protein